jgi:hypothetical protein
MRSAIYLSVLAMLTLSVSSSMEAQDNAKGHYHFVGSMSASLAEGAVPGQVTSGIPFTTILSDKGASISPSTFELKGPKWTGTATLTLDGAKYADGHLTGTLKLSNGSGSVLEGVRLDIRGATEEYKAKDNQGNDVLRTRSEQVSLASPLLFGDIPKGEEADKSRIDVSGITFGPDTTRVMVNGALSGLYYTGGWQSDTVIAPMEMDADSQGRLYFADVVANRVARYNPDRTNLTTTGKLPDQQCLGCAVNPKTGEIYATCTNIKDIFKYTPGGVDDGKIIASDDTGYIHLLRTNRAGTILYGGSDGSVLNVFYGDKLHHVISKVGDYDVMVTGFDVSSSGILWICSNGNLLKLEADGTTGKRIASGPDWHLGRLYGPATCRTDNQENVYVLEEGNDQEETFEYARVSMWDKLGRQVRVFGYGGKPARGDDPSIPGQVRYPIDLAILPDGTVAIAGKTGAGNSSTVVSLFMPF